MSTLPSPRVQRFVIAAVCATLAVFGLFYVEFFVFPDTTPPTRFQNNWFMVWAVAAWPLSVVWMMSEKDPPKSVIILLQIASGIFWAFFAEWLISVKRRVWPGKSRRATTTAAGVDDL
jgi:hypothetical protein